MFGKKKKKRIHCFISLVGKSCYRYREKRKEKFDMFNNNNNNN